MKMEMVNLKHGGRNVFKNLPSARRQTERITTRTARPANTPTMIATVFPTWSSLLEESIPIGKAKKMGISTVDKD